MTQEETKQLKALYVATALYFDQKIPDPALALYCEDLVDLSFSDVSRAIGELRRDPRTTRCPLPSMIRARLTPESNPESEAIMVIGRIVQAIAKIGPYRTADAKHSIGAIGWRVVQMDGGWEQVCGYTTDALGIHKAQWRNMARALIERGVGDETETPRLPEPPSAPMRTIDFSAMLKPIPGGGT